MNVQQKGDAEVFATIMSLAMASQECAATKAVYMKRETVFFLIEHNWCFADVRDIRSIDGEVELSASPFFAIENILKKNRKKT